MNTFHFAHALRFSLAAALLGLGACGGEEPTAVEVPETYSFESRLAEGTSVAYAGQVFRQVLVVGLGQRLSRLTERIDAQGFAPAPGEVARELGFYFEFDPQTALGEPVGMSTTPPPRQASWGDISSSGANLKGKIAGNDDPQLQHKDWRTELRGWSAPGASTPESLVQSWFDEIDALAVARANGTLAMDPSGMPIASAHVNARGHDLKELIEKFLGGAIALSQGTDDYLDDDVEGKGLRSDNRALEEGKSYTVLEHAWDEGFGYFGAARDYGLYTDDELSAADGRDGWKSGYHDADGDGRIDLASEFNFGHSVNAAKRDRGSAQGARTDFTGDAIRAFLRGRAIIAAAAGRAFTDEEFRALQAERDAAVRAWENAIAATVVHYVNEVLVDMGRFGAAEYDFLGHAEHWSELKGFALALQFNPRSPLGDSDFERLHERIGMAPVLAGQSGVEAYRAALLEARATVGSAYGFAAANLGDEGGSGGW